MRQMTINLNINIVKNLKTTRSCVRVSKVEIDEDLKQYLTKKYDLVYRFISFFILVC